MKTRRRFQLFTMLLLLVSGCSKEAGPEVDHHEISQRQMQMLEERTMRVRGDSKAEIERLSKEIEEAKAMLKKGDQGKDLERTGLVRRIEDLQKRKAELGLKQALREAHVELEREIRKPANP